MAGSRTLKLSILADVADLRNKLSQGSQEVEGFGGKVAEFGKKAGLAFAAAGAAAAAYAGKLLIDGVKAAAEDEAAQTKLLGTLQRVTGASLDQVQALEEWISEQGVLLGVTDDELRPSLDRLVRATKNVTQAQELASLAMDISASTGKSLESVSTALAKAQEGNVASLAKLTGGFEKADLKGTTLSNLLPALTARFQGAAEQGADTFSGKMERLNIAFSEAKETIGAYVLTAITPLLTTLVNNVIPAIQTLSTDIGQKLQPTFEKLIEFFQEFIIPIFKTWWEFISKTVIPGIVKTFSPILEALFNAFEKIAKAIKDNESNLKPLFELFKAVAGFVVEKLAPAIGKILGAAITVITELITTLIGAFAKLVGFIDNVIDRIRALIKLVKENPLVQGIGAVIDRVFGGERANGGAVASNKAYLVGERGAELFVPNANGTIIPNGALGGGVVNNYNINVTGALDREGVARQIVDLLNNSYYRGTIGGAALQL